MEHTEAVETLACERYLLDELTPEDRDAFEEHYFGCVECAADVKAEAAIVSEMRARKVRRQPRQWAAWSSVAVTAVLVCVVAYQNGVVIPELRQQREAAMQPGVLNILSFSAGVSRGGEEKTASAKTNLALAVDIEPRAGATGYLLEVVDTHGVTRLRYHASAEEAKETVKLLPPGGKLPPGHYTLNVKAEPAGQPVSSQSFVVQ
jgi:hypothetical protein